jgi:hypothetical protein
MFTVSPVRYNMVLMYYTIVIYYRLYINNIIIGDKCYSSCRRHDQSSHNRVDYRVSIFFNIVLF